MYDCIIVGAGPAGGSAAYHLAKRGRSVLVLEKAALPRYKPCAGGVSPEVAQWFDFDFSPVISLRVNRVRYTWNQTMPVEADLGESEPIWMVRRDLFDHYLIQQAQGQGAALRDQTEVTQITFNRDATPPHWQVHLAAAGPDGQALPPLTAQYLIAADGAKGNMAKWLGFKERKRRFYAALEAETRQTITDHRAHFDFGRVKNGYIWNFPKADGYSIGICTFGGTTQNLRAMATDYAQSFGVDFTSIKEYGHPICAWDGDQPLHTHHALLAGEAACVVDPFTAEGIRPSMFTGVQAALAIDQSLAGDAQALPNYTQTIHQDLGRELIWAQRLANIFYRVPQLGYRLGIKQPSAHQKMVKILCGEERYSRLASSAIKKLSAGLIPG
jgi:geranylgeranyl reductase family protein